MRYCLIETFADNTITGLLNHFPGRFPRWSPDRALHQFKKRFIGGIFLKQRLRMLMTAETRDRIAQCTKREYSTQHRFFFLY
ncbi:MAG: hypothetical protein HZB12_01760 [Candidatus Yonathbacteria bacterium]|nr:hypothetical protein [Candidatus Yonathbacteria bacterium]